MKDSIRICFVCLGNIVRSPLAENVFRHLAEERGLGWKYEVDSAGTGSWHVGEAPDPRMRRVAAHHGLVYTGRAKQFNPRHFDRYDLIIAMDRENQSTLEAWAPTSATLSKIHLLREFDPQSDPHMPVPDPYYGGLEGFERVYEIVTRSCAGLLDALESGELELA